MPVLPHRLSEVLLREQQWAVGEVEPGLLALTVFQAALVVVALPIILSAELARNLLHTVTELDLLAVQVLATLTTLAHLVEAVVALAALVLITMPVFQVMEVLEHLLL
jgi:hypothetical protein